MSRELRRLAFALAEEALELSSEQREQWLEVNCGDNPALLSEVRAILEADESASDFTGAMLDIKDTPATDFVGRTLGRYRIVDVLGEGGMGVVFKGERVGDFEQTVALKIVRQGLDSGSARLRFDLERDALARIEHPSIARLIDAGVDDDNRPYFVMEYVDGVPLDTFLEEQQLDLRERLLLFKRICDGVAAAQ